MKVPADLYARSPRVLGKAGLSALDVGAETQPPHGEFAEAIEGVGGGKGHAVVGANGVREAKFPECPPPLPARE